MVIIEKSRAWQALTELLATEGQPAIAKRSEVSQPMLSLIAALKREPGAGTKIKFQKLLGIAIEWWDEPLPCDSLGSERRPYRRLKRVATGTDGAR